MTDAASAFVRRRQPESLEELGELMSKQPHVQSMGLQAIEDTIAQHRRATEQSTYRDDAPRDVLSDIALLVASLPLRAAMQMAEAIVTLPDYKPPATKIELAMQLNEWAEKRLEPPPK